MDQVHKVTRIGIKYLYYHPPELSGSGKYPFILYLHGAGERGNDLEKLTRQAIPKLIDQGTSFPFIIVSPQCPANVSWKKVNLIAFLDEVLENDSIDVQRLYVTGNSMGGYATWHLACDFHYMFAAVAPICGGGDVSKVSNMKNLPTWVFHGKNDPIVPFQESANMVHALRKAGGDVKFTVYDEVGHDSWTPAYKSPEFYAWFLKHERNKLNR